MTEQQITELVAFAKVHPDLSPIFGDRVQYVSFVNEQTGTSLLIRDLTEDSGVVKTESLIEFRVVSADVAVGPLQVRSYLSKIRSVFEKNTLRIGESAFYQVDALGDVFIAQNEKRQYEAVTSMIFKTA